MQKQLKPYLQPSTFFRFLAFYLSAFVLCFLFVALFLPWTIYSSGSGRVTAVDPNERIQNMTAPVDGFISSWKVKEGSIVKRGDPLVELVDNDPSILDRVEREKEAALAAVEASKLALQTAELNLKRQMDLLKDGLTSRREYEKSKIEVSKHSIELSKAEAILAKAETQLSRQKTQNVVAPRDGTILRILPGEGNHLVKSGEPLLVFAPKLNQTAVELWISGQDISFVEKGQPVRVEFEGWPSVQVPGWPSIAIGTFKAQVHLVDYASSQNGKFRVLVTPADEPWPSSNFLKLNASAKATVFLAPTRVGKEIWRKLNNYPPSQELIVDELSGMLGQKVDLGRKLSSEGKEK